MKVASINLLLDSVRALYGGKAIRPYADSPDDPYGTGFSLEGIDATFSVLTQAGQLPEGQYDVRIESAPPGDYLYTAVVSLEEFMALLRAVSGPKNTWPG